MSSSFQQNLCVLPAGSGPQRQRVSCLTVDKSFRVKDSLAVNKQQTIPGSLFNHSFGNMGEPNVELRVAVSKAEGPNGSEKSWIARNFYFDMHFYEDYVLGPY